MNHGCFFIHPLKRLEQRMKQIIAARKNGSCGMTGSSRPTTPSTVKKKPAVSQRPRWKVLSINAKAFSWTSAREIQTEHRVESEHEVHVLKCVARLTFHQVVNV